MLWTRHCSRLLQHVRFITNGGASNMSTLPNGVWPTMITPFLNDSSKSVDWQTLDILTDWYIRSGCAGLFTVCLSSEMFQLSNEERVSVARHVAKRANGRVPVVAGATFGGTLSEQAELMKEIGKYVDATVIITNQICHMKEGDDIWLDNVKSLMDMTGDIPLGLYETPVPQVRALTPEMLAWCAGSGRFLFHKDTSVNTDIMLHKLKAVQSLPHNNMKFFTAKIQFLSTILENGGSGFSGVTANYFPWLMVWLCNNYQHTSNESRAKVQQFLSVADRVIAHKYPTSSKFYLFTHYNMPILPESRVHSVTFNDQDAFSLQSLHDMMLKLCQELSITPVDPMTK